MTILPGFLKKQAFPLRNFFLRGDEILLNSNTSRTRQAFELFLKDLSFLSRPVFKIQSTNVQMNFWFKIFCRIYSLLDQQNNGCFHHRKRTSCKCAMKNQELWPCRIPQLGKPAQASSYLCLSFNRTPFLILACITTYIHKHTLPLKDTLSFVVVQLPTHVQLFATP